MLDKRELEGKDSALDQSWYTTPLLPQTLLDTRQLWRRYLSPFRTRLSYARQLFDNVTGTGL